MFQKSALLTAALLGALLLAGGQVGAQVTLQENATSQENALLIVRASGQTGDEEFEVRVGGVAVASFTATETLADYQVAIDADTPISNIEVAFTNDARLAQDYDRNLVVDYIDLAGVRFQTEADSTTSTGTWNSATGCDPSSETVSETLHCGGAFTYAAQDAEPGSPGNRNFVSVRAAGNTGEEQLEIRVDGIAIARFTVTETFETYSTELSPSTGTNNIEIAFINNAGLGEYDRNLIVDYIEVPGLRLQTEAESTTSTGTWSPTTDCAPSSATESETLHCNGAFKYSE